MFILGLFIITLLISSKLLRVQDNMNSIDQAIKEELKIIKYKRRVDNMRELFIGAYITIILFMYCMIMKFAIEFSKIKL
jgi:hypothetical protein